ncbi:MAG: hypothetical protein BWY58_00985 [Chloroflexi bacterium ADurb.Bin344]|nr:MAG: hypothetical protein BWY58_00985 [Chloroflexi bacterium ADurb.Bin344]
MNDRNDLWLIGFNGGFDSIQIMDGFIITKFNQLSISVNRPCHVCKTFSEKSGTDCQYFFTGKNTTFNGTPENGHCLSGLNNYFRLCPEQNAQFFPDGLIKFKEFIFTISGTEIRCQGPISNGSYSNRTRDHRNFVIFHSQEPSSQPLQDEQS